MKGLLYKEFKMFECQVKTWAAVLVFLLACAVFAGETGPFYRRDVRIYGNQQPVSLYGGEEKRKRRLHGRPSL